MYILKIHFSIIDVSDLFKDEETVKREAEEKEKTAALQFQANLIKAQMLQQQQAAAAQQAQLQQPQQGKYEHGDSTFHLLT